MKYKRNLLASTLLAVSIFALSKQTTFAQENQNIIDIGQGAKVVQDFSTIYNEDAKIKTSIQASFINDPNSNKKIAIISTAGSNIAADKKIINTSFAGGEPGEYTANLEWPSSYQIKMELNDDHSKFFKAAPANTVDTKTVTSSVGYTIGGGIKVSDKPDGSISGSVAFSTSAQYSQADYKTFLTSDSDKKIDWKISFVSAMNQGYGPYDRDSNNPTYGNQLFMKTRNGSVWAKDNFISNEQMPGLSSYGFSPGVIAVVITDKNETRPSPIKITLGRIKDSYNLKWNGVSWAGNMVKNVNLTYGSVSYKIDWENNRLIP